MIDGNIALIVALGLLLVVGAPVAVAVGLAGFIAIAIGLDSSALPMVGTNTFASIAKYPLVAIPLFILTGVIFERSGVAARLVTFAQAIVGPRRGGLAVVAVLVCMIMGGISGSGPADAAAVATIMLPSMMRAGYPNAFSASVIAAGASTALLIPPSIALIVYSLYVPGVDLRALFAAGLIPGILAGLAVILPAVLISRRYGFGAGEEARRPEFWPSLIDAVPGLFAPVLILGGLRSGLFTPTEAAAVAVFYGLAIGLFVYRNMSLRGLYEALADAAETSAAVLLIVGLAGLFAWAGSTLGAFDSAAAAILAWTHDPIIVLLLIMAVLLFAGMILDGVSIYLITLPLLYPMAVALDWNLVWFGVLMAINVAIGQFTPPVAVNLIVTARIGKVPIEHTVGWVLWMVLAMALVLLAIILVPDLALWLPTALGYRV